MGRGEQYINVAQDCQRTGDNGSHSIWQWLVGAHSLLILILTVSLFLPTRSLANVLSNAWGEFDQAL